MEAVSVLAAGVAHEINTPVQFIGDSLFFLDDTLDVFQQVVGHLDDLTRSLDPTHRVEFEQLSRRLDLEFIQEEGPEAVQRCRAGIERIASIVRSLSEYAQPPDTDASPIEVERLIRDAVSATQGSWWYTCEVEVELGHRGPVLAVPGQLAQVLVHLIGNAVHAMQAAPDRQHRMVIRTEDADGDHVRISVHDTGTGIPARIADHIMRPFFTTKSAAGRQGQGLAIAHRMMRHMGGDISFETATGIGTTFHLTLPKATTHE